MASFWGKGIVCTQCPYYDRESNFTITCEGIVKETEIVTRFSTKEEKEKFQEEHCYQYPNKCYISSKKDAEYDKEV